MKKTKIQIEQTLEKRLEELCLKTLGYLPTGEPLFPGMPRMEFPVSFLSGKNRKVVKKEWDKYLKNLDIKRRIVKLDESEKYRVFGGKGYPKRLNIPECITVGDPFGGCYAVLDIPNNIAMKIVLLGFAPTV